MKSQVAFQSGNPRTYTATRGFGLGNTNMTITSGQEVVFDGTYVTHSGHPPVALPQLRGAVQAGWLVPSEDYDPEDLSASIPRAAGIQVRSADGGNPMNPQPRALVTTVDAEEQEVGNVASHAQNTRNLNKTRRTPGQRSTMGAAEAQEGIAVRSLSTPAVQSTNLEKESAESAIRTANSARVVPGRGRTREELMAHMNEEEQAEYVAKLGAKKMAHVDESPIVGRVAVVKNQQKEGFKVTNSVGNGIEIHDAGGTGTTHRDQIVEAEAEGIKFTNTNTRIARVKPAKSVGAAETDPRRRIAKSICPDFPDNYVFEDTPRKKIARLQADYEDRPDVIRAVAAAETDGDVRVRLLQEFPDAFG
jgi:hypothetical protein